MYNRKNLILLTSVRDFGKRRFLAVLGFNYFWFDRFGNIGELDLEDRIDSQNNFIQLN